VSNHFYKVAQGFSARPVKFARNQHWPWARCGASRGASGPLPRHGAPPGRGSLRLCGDRRRRPALVNAIHRAAPSAPIAFIQLSPTARLSLTQQITPFLTQTSRKA